MQGKRTFDFLKAQHDIAKATDHELKKLSNLAQPKAPDLSEIRSAIQRSRAERAYRLAMIQYWGAVIQRCQQIQDALNDAETKISGLDSAGVGEDALSLTKTREHMLGDMVQMCAEVRALASLAQEELQANPREQIVSDLAAGIVTAAAVYVSGGALAGALTTGEGAFANHLSRDVKAGIERRQDVQAHYASLQNAIAEFQRDRGEAVTKRSELVTAFRARFPQYDWNSLLPAENQKAQQR